MVDMIDTPDNYDPGDMSVAPPYPDIHDRLVQNLREALIEEGVEPGPKLDAEVESLVAESRRRGQALRSRYITATDRKALIYEARAAIEGRRGFVEDTGRPATKPLLMQVDPHLLLRALGAEEEA